MTTTDTIRLVGLRGYGYHGVLPAERRDGQEFGVDVVVHLDTRRAAATDDLAATVDYGTLAQRVVDVVTGEPFDLIETLAEHVAAVALEAPLVQAVEVTVHKPSAPVPVPFTDVEVRVVRSRDRMPTVAATLPAPQDDEDPAALEVPALVPDPAGANDTAAQGLPPVPLPTAHGADVVPGDRLDERPSSPVHAVLALGANLGDATAVLREAVRDIDALAGVTVEEVGPLARTLAVGGPEQPDYLNTVVVVTTTLAPRELLAAVHEVEQSHGRVREVRWGPRTLDVDIITYGTLVAAAEDLEIPHPRAHERAFVLLPWSHAEPDAVLGGLGGGPVAALAETAPDRGGVRSLALDWLRGSGGTGSHAATTSSTPRPGAAEQDAG